MGSIVYEGYFRVFHGRLVFDICLDEPKIKKSNFGQMKDALLEEIEHNDRGLDQETSKPETRKADKKINTDVGIIKIAGKKLTNSRYFVLNIYLLQCIRKFLHPPLLVIF